MKKKICVPLGMIALAVLIFFFKDNIKRFINNYREDFGEEEEGTPTKDIITFIIIGLLGVGLVSYIIMDSMRYTKTQAWRQNAGQRMIPKEYR